MARLELQSVVLRPLPQPLGRRASGSQSYRLFQRAHVSPQTGKSTPRIQPYSSIPWTCGRVSHQLLFCLARFSARLHLSGARTCLSTLQISEPSRLTIGGLTRQCARTGHELLRNPRNLSATSAGPLKEDIMMGHRAMRIGKQSHYVLHVGTPPTDVALHGQLDFTQWSQRFPIVIPSGLLHAAHVHPWPRLGCSPWESKRPHGCNVPPRTRIWNLRLRRPTPYPLGQQTN